MFDGELTEEELMGVDQMGLSKMNELVMADKIGDHETVINLGMELLQSGMLRERDIAVITEMVDKAKNAINNKDVTNSFRF